MGRTLKKGFINELLYQGKYMTKIRKQAFSNRIREYLVDSGSFEELRFDRSLFTVSRQQVPDGSLASGLMRSEEVMHGLRFGAHIDLVMILLDHAYKGLKDKTTIDEFSRAAAEAMQHFATPIAEGSSSSFPYPHFLLHGMRQTTLGASISRMKRNGVIIHKTLALRDNFMKTHGGPTFLGNGIKMLMEDGAAEDWFGICCYLTREDEDNSHGSDTSYIAKASFFLDPSRKDVYVITLQGQRVSPKAKERSRDYARLGAKLSMDPRAYVLRKACTICTSEGYKKVKVIRPEQHPLFIDHEEGFMARYEPIIRQSGITKENGCYLENNL